VFVWPFTGVVTSWVSSWAKMLVERNKKEKKNCFTVCILSIIEWGE
jgi:hypothetical protein